jgi:hypothetical protein
MMLYTRENRRLTGELGTLNTSLQYPLAGPGADRKVGTGVTAIVLMCCLSLHAAESGDDTIRDTLLDTDGDVLIEVHGKNAHVETAVSTNKNITLRITAAAFAKISGRARIVYVDVTSRDAIIDLSGLLADDIVFVSKCDNVNILGLRAKNTIHFLQEIANNTKVRIITSKNIYFHKIITNKCVLRMNALKYIIGNGDVTNGSSLYINQNIILSKFPKIDRSSRIEFCENPGSDRRE